MDKAEKTNSKIGWTEEEQSYLRVLSNGKHITDWKYISNQMNAVFPHKNRTSKQCRQRFHNYIRFMGEELQKETWSAEEDQNLFNLYINVGSKWAEISKSMPGRSENNIKNRFYGKLRKFIRVMNEVLKKSSIKNRKPIQQRNITKILSREKFSNELAINSTDQRDKSEGFLDRLKLDILNGVLRSDQQLNQEHLTNLLHRVHQFNLQARAENIRENRLGKKTKRKRLPPLLKEGMRQISICDKDYQQEGVGVGLSMIGEGQGQKEKNEISEIIQENSFSEIEVGEEFRAQMNKPFIFEEEISFIFTENKRDVENFGSFQF